MTGNVTPLNIADHRLISTLVDKICDLVDNIPNQIVLPALAEVVGICLEMANKSDRRTLFDTFCARVWEVPDAVWVKLDAPKPDKITPFKPLDPTEEP